MRLTILFLFLCNFYSLCASEKADIDTLHQRAYRLLNSDPDSAFALSVMAEAKAAGMGLHLEEAKSLFIQAYIYRQKEELGKSFVLYLKALELLRPLEDEKVMLTYAKILLNTGAILDYHYAYQQSVKYYDEGISVAIKYQLEEMLVTFYNSKALSLRHNDHHDEALNTIKIAIELAKQNTDEKMVLSSLNQQGLILKDMGRYAEARQSYQQVINFAFDQVSPEKHRGQAWHNIAVTYLEEKRYTEAERAYLKAANENQKRPGSREEYITWMDLGETYYLMGKHEQAYEMAQKALALYDEMLLLPDHYAIFGLLSKITYELGEHDQSHAYSEQFMAVNRHFLQAQKEILQVKDQYKMEILTAGFFLEIEISKMERKYQIILAICVGLLLMFIGYEKIRQYTIRRKLKKAILDIEQEFDV